MRMAPQRSHVSRWPPRTAVRQVSIAWSARRWTDTRRCVRRYASPWARTMAASSSRGRTPETAVPGGDTVHTTQAGGRIVGLSSNSSRVAWVVSDACVRCQ